MEWIFWHSIQGVMVLVIKFLFHGLGLSEGGKENELSLELMTLDLETVIRNTYPDYQTREFVLIGHRCYIN